MTLFYVCLFGLIACGDKDSTDTDQEIGTDNGVHSETETSLDSGSDSGSDDTAIDDADGLSCDDIPDCGGGATGIWSYTELCGDTKIVDIQQYQDYQLRHCPEIMNLDFDETVTGTLTFADDGSGLNDFTLYFNYLFTWPFTDCPLASGHTTCSDVHPDEMHLPPSQVSFSCGDSAVEGACDCISSHEHSFAVEYAMSFENNIATFDNMNGGVSEFQYCVQENMLLAVSVENGDSILYTRSD